MDVLALASMQAHVTAEVGWVDYLIIGIYSVTCLRYHRLR
jgi:hypothetical protein